MGNKAFDVTALGELSDEFIVKTHPYYNSNKPEPVSA